MDALHAPKLPLHGKLVVGGMTRFCRSCCLTFGRCMLRVSYSTGSRAMRGDEGEVRALYLPRILCLHFTGRFLFIL